MLTAASALATNVAAAASAVYAGIKAVEKGADNPFPANIIAIAAGLAAVVVAVASAKQLATATKYADGTPALGSDGVLSGPTHAQGGIGLYGKYGHFYGEAEHGEAISPADASRHNAAALSLIRTKGRTRTLTPADFAQAANFQIKAPSGNFYAAGGVMGLRGGAGAATGQAGANTDLSAMASSLDAMAAHLEQISDATAATANHTGAIRSYGPAQLNIGPVEAVAISREKDSADLSKSFVTI